jgi:hypothetical protein
MSESIPHVVSAIKAKRDEIFRQITDLEARVMKLRASLASLDAAAVLLVPDHSGQIVRRRTRYFARNELSRLALDGLRKVGSPMSLSQIAAHAIKERNLPDSSLSIVMDMLFPVLRKLVGRGSVIKTGHTRDAKWAVTESG